jgi:FlaA1/EpsC-like NDP-sugar epimerase
MRTEAQWAQLRALIVGAGEAGRAIGRDLRGVPEFGLDPIGFLDDHETISGVPGLSVLGVLDDLGDVLRDHNPDVVVIAIPALARARVHQMAAIASAWGASVRYLPSFIAALERDARTSDLKSLSMAHLIGRDEAHVVSAAAREVVAGKRVLVTGSGGSIGGELCRQVASFDPAKLYMLDHDESNLHGLQLRMSGRALLDDDGILIADIRDARRMEQVFAQCRPEVVFHAAALKHLPLLEQHPCEGVKSNVLGTQNLIEAALRHNTERFVLISTDKAADPTSVLGATKRLAELLAQAYGNGPMRIASVRFGNVLGSRGSLLTVIEEQVTRGEPVTITHPDVTRFFMTVEEAVGLVFEAARMADSGEIFVLDMGAPVRVVDLVNSYAEQRHAAADLKILFTGLRPGEKLNETLFGRGEEQTQTEHPRISVTRSRSGVGELLPLLRYLYDSARANEPAQVRRLFSALLPDYDGPAPLVPPRPGVLSAPYPDGF